MNVVKEMFMKINNDDEREILSDYFKTKIYGDFIVVNNKDAFQSMTDDYFFHHYIRNHKISHCYETNAAKDIELFYKYGIVNGGLAFKIQIDTKRHAEILEQIIRKFDKSFFYKDYHDNPLVVISKFKVSKFELNEMAEFNSVPAIRLHPDKPETFDKIVELFQHKTQLDNGYYIYTGKKYYFVTLNRIKSNNNFFSSIELTEIKKPSKTLVSGLKNHPNGYLVYKSSNGFEDYLKRKIRIVKELDSDRYVLVDDFEEIVSVNDLKN